MADQLKKSSSGKVRRLPAGKFGSRAGRHLSIETIEGRLLLSVAPLTMPGPTNTIFFTPYAAPTSGENSSGTAPAAQPPSDQGGFINPTGPTVLSIGNGTGQISAPTSSQANAIGQQLDFDALISRGITYVDIRPCAVTNGITPVFMRIDFTSGEGGPIGIAPMNRPGSQSSEGDSSVTLSAERNRGVAPSEFSMLASASISKFSGEWARPAISEVAGGEPLIVEKHRSKPAESDFLPTSLPKINVEHSGARHGAEADSVNSDSVQSREIPTNAVMMRELDQGDRLVDDALAVHDYWTAVPKQSAPFAQPASFFAPSSSYIDSILDDQTTNQHHAPVILTLKPDDRAQKAAVLKHTSMINLLRSSLSYEPVLFAFLLDYAAVRYCEQRNQQPSAESVRRIKKLRPANNR